MTISFAQCHPRCSLKCKFFCSARKGKEFYYRLFMFATPLIGELYVDVSSGDNIQVSLPIPGPVLVYICSRVVLLRRGQETFAGKRVRLCGIRPQYCPLIS